MIDRPLYSMALILAMAIIVEAAPKKVPGNQPMPIESLLRTASTLTLTEASERFRLADLLAKSGIDDGCGHGLYLGPDDHVFLLSGDRQISGSIQLNPDEEPWSLETRPRGLIVDGDLLVDGNLLNSRFDEGAFLVVLGELRIKNGLFGGSIVHVEGQVEAGGILSSAGDGFFESTGSCTAALVIGENVRSAPSSTVPAWAPEQQRTSIGKPLADFLVDTIPAAELESPTWDEQSGMLKSEQGMAIIASITEHLEADRPVLRPDLPRMDRQAWVHAVVNDPELFDQVPPEMLNPAFCLDVVKRNGWALYKVPEVHRTAAVSMAAVRKTGSAIEHVPAHHLTPELAEIADQTARSPILSLLPESFLSAHPEMLRPAVEADAGNLRYVPQHHLSESLVLSVIDQNHVLRFLPEAFLRAHSTLFTKALRADPSNLGSIPEDLVSEALIMSAIEGCHATEMPASLVLGYIRESAVTPAVATAIAVSSPYVISGIPEAALTGEVLLAAYQAHGPLPSTVLEGVSDAVKKEFGRLKLAATEWHTEEDPTTGLSFEQPTAWSLEPGSIGPRSWLFSFEDERFALVSLYSAAKAPSPKRFIRLCEKGQSKLAAGVAWVMGVRYKTLADRQVKRQGFAGSSKQIQQIIKDLPLARSEVLSLAKRFGEKTVLVYFRYPLDKGHPTPEEIDHFLASIDLQPPT